MAILVMMVMMLAACGGSNEAGAPTLAGGDNPPSQIPDTGNPRGDAGTISFQVKPAWDGSNPTDAQLLRIGSPGQFEQLSVLKNGTDLRVLSSDAVGQENSIGVSITDWQPGQYHVISFTWGDGVEGLYIDGQLVGQIPYQGALEVPPGTPLQIGAASQPGADAPISHFQVYGRPLTPQEIAGLAGAQPAAN